MNENKGLTVQVFRSPEWQREGYDPTNGGQSSKVERFTVVGTMTRDGQITPLPRESQVFSPREDAPAAVLMESALRGAAPNLVPLADHERSKGNCGHMCGGNIASWSDSRLSEIVEKMGGSKCSGMVSIHDRVETWEEYKVLST